MDFLRDAHRLDRGLELLFSVIGFFFLLFFFCIIWAPCIPPASRDRLLFNKVSLVEQCD